MHRSRTAVYVFTPQGLALAKRLAGELPLTVFVPDALAARAEGARPFSKLDGLLAETFRRYDCHIFIAACGIAVRAVAPLLRGKASDPAVLVMDQRGRHVISLLSGHLGGANAMAERVAATIGATPVITTATDVEGLPAIDALASARGLAIGNLEAVKSVSAALLRGETVTLDDPRDLLGLADGPWRPLFARAPESDKTAHIIVTERAPESGPHAALYLHPRVLACGVGCKKNTPAEAVLEAIRAMLADSGYAPQSLACIASIDAKRDEPGLAEAARKLGLPFRVFAPHELAAHPPRTPSPKALERFGVVGVCESAALAAASLGGATARLLVPKRVSPGVTVALASGHSPADFRDESE